MEHSTEYVISELRAGNPVVVFANQKGFLVTPALSMSERTLRTFFKFAHGTLRVAMSDSRAIELFGAEQGKQVLPSIRLKGKESESNIGKAATIIALAQGTSHRDDFEVPGDVFQVRVADDGLLHNIGIEEATIDLSKMATKRAVGVFMECHNAEGDVATESEIRGMAAAAGLAVIEATTILEHRKTQELLIHHEVETHLPTKYGDFVVVAYTDDIEHKEYLAIVKGDVSGKDQVMVRLHSECFTGDVLGSRKCDCGEQLHFSLQQIEAKGEGAVIYLRQEGRGIGLINKLKAYNLQAVGYDTVEANSHLGFGDDLRDYAVAAQILKDLDIRSVELMTNNPTKILGLAKYGVRVSKREEIEIPANEENRRYLQTKKEKMGHILRQKF